MKKLVLIFAMIVIYHSAFSDDKVKLAWQVDGQNVSYSGMCVSESGKYAFTLFTSVDIETFGNFNYDVQMWNIETGIMEKAFPVPADYFENGGNPEFSCSADDSRLLVYISNSSEYWLFDIESGEQWAMKRLGSQSYIEKIRFAELTDDGSMFLTRLSNRNYLEMIYSETGETAFKVQLPEGADEYGCIASNSLYFATYFNDSTVKIINTVTGKVVREMKITSECRVRALSSDYRHLTYTVADSAIYIIETEDLTVVEDFIDNIHFVAPTQCKFSKDDNKCILTSDGISEPWILWVGNDSYGYYKNFNETMQNATGAFLDEDRIIYFDAYMALSEIDFKNEEKTVINSRHGYDKHFADVTGVAFDKINDIIYTSSHDCTIKTWKQATGEFNDTFFEGSGQIEDVAISVNSDSLVALLGHAGFSYSIPEYNSLPGTGVSEAWSSLSEVEFCPNSNRNGYFIFLDYFSENIFINYGLVTIFAPSNYSYSCLAWSNDGEYIAVGTLDDRIAIFDVYYQPSNGLAQVRFEKWINCASGNPQYFTRGITDIEFSPDDTELLVIAETSDTPMIISIEDGSQKVDFEEFASDDILEAEFLGNSGIIAVGGTLGNITFLDSKTGKVIENYGELRHKWDYISGMSENLLKTTTMEYLESGKLLVFGTNYGDIVALDVSELLASSSVEDVAEHKLSIYPNPAENFINIDVPEYSKIKIFDLTGYMMLETIGSRIDISNLTAGIYMIVIENNGEISRQKFIKK